MRTSSPPPFFIYLYFISLGKRTSIQEGVAEGAGDAYTARLQRGRGNPVDGTRCRLKTASVPIHQEEVCFIWSGDTNRVCGGDGTHGQLGLVVGPKRSVEKASENASPQRRTHP